jgi:hypothetical protein
MLGNRKDSKFEYVVNYSQPTLIKSYYFVGQLRTFRILQTLTPTEQTPDPDRIMNYIFLYKKKTNFFRISTGSTSAHNVLAKFQTNCWTF